MPRTRKRIDVLELRDALSLASILGALPIEAVRESLRATTGLGERSRTLTREFVVYLTVFLCIFKDVATDEVLRHLFEGLESLFEGKDILRASDAAISKARNAVGEEPLRHLFRSQCKPLCGKGDEYAFYKGMRKLAIDASEFYLQCTKDVLAEFPTCESDAKNPQNCSKIKFGAVMEIGSRAYIDVEYGTVLNSEQDFADALIGRLGPGNLLIGDRYYRSVLNIQRVKDQGSDVLFRATSNMLLAPVKTLYDGSYLAEIRAAKGRKRHSAQFGKQIGSVMVRVIPYVIKDAKGQVIEPGRLITTLLEPANYHSQDLIDIYVERWAVEMGFDEIKSHLMLGAQDNLRSKKSNLVRQEFWAMFMAHYLIRKIIYEASALAEKMPDKTSFFGVRNLLRRKTTAKPFPPREDEQEETRRACRGDAQGLGRKGARLARLVKQGEE